MMKTAFFLTALASASAFAPVANNRAATQLGETKANLMALAQKTSPAIKALNRLDCLDLPIYLLPCQLQ
jgi:hypothetical protein